VSRGLTSPYGKAAAGAMNDFTSPLSHWLHRRAGRNRGHGGGGCDRQPCLLGRTPLSARHHRSIPPTGGDKVFAARVFALG